jgi:hypothetical protein
VGPALLYFLAHERTIVSLMRLALKSHTFSNGVHVPKGTSLAAPAIATHEDEENYDEPFTFNPWRFSSIRGTEGENAKHQFVNTNPEVSWRNAFRVIQSRLIGIKFLSFGHGKHAWLVLFPSFFHDISLLHRSPGRFFAANELKLMLAHLVVNYDVQFENSSHIRPPNVYFSNSCVPNPTAKVCFRKRQS